MIYSMSWKNVWRNKLRSLVVIASVAVGVMAGTFMIALMQGWIDQRSRDAIYVESAHIQIHHPKYRTNEAPEFRLDSADFICSTISRMPQVEACAKRTQVLAMANAGYKPAGFFVRGIDVEDEKKVSELYKYIVDSVGTYFDEYRSKPIFMSEKSAKELRLQNYVIDSSALVYFQLRNMPTVVLDSLQSIQGQTFRNKSIFFKALQQLLSTANYKEWKSAIEKRCAFFRLNNKIELTVRSTTGDEVSSVFRLVGVFKTSNSLFDTKYAYVLDKDLRKLTQWPKGQVHEIATIVKNPDEVVAIADTIQQKFPNTEVVTWRTVLPEVAMYSDMMTFYAIVFMVIILFALGFGIVNTMLMVVLERTKELGMLMAIGMSHGRIFGMIIIETVMLSIVGGVGGMILGASLVSFFSNYGINLTAFADGMEAMGFASVIYPHLSFIFYIQITVLVILTGIISAIYPARKATKLIPAEAVRTE